ncbi:MAG TPA: hypothetical protein PL090_08500, partial [Syntrophales bacterium]|nr:hypothetical protein [Syntrophales bacterium]
MTGTLLLGIGNIHREDDGVGPKCVDLVSFPGVHRLVVQQLVPELAETIRDYERVVFVDASLRGGNAELGPLLPRDTDTSFPLTHGRRGPSSAFPPRRSAARPGAGGDDPGLRT